MPKSDFRHGGVTRFIVALSVVAGIFICFQWAFDYPREIPDSGNESGIDVVEAADIPSEPKQEKRLLDDRQSQRQLTGHVDVEDVSSQMSNSWPSFEQCDLLKLGMGDQSEPMVTSLNRFLPTGVEVHCTYRTSFEYQGRSLDFIFIVYGQKTGCPDDCYANNMCVLQDGPDSYLYSAFWRNDEAPLNLEDECPVLAQEEYGNTLLYCESPPSGYHHPATNSENFRLVSLAAREDVPLKYCLWGHP